MTKKSTLQAIYKYLKQPEKLEFRKHPELKPQLYPNRNLKRNYGFNKKPHLFMNFNENIKTWCSVTRENIDHGKLLHLSFLERFLK